MTTRLTRRHVLAAMGAVAAAGAVGAGTTAWRWWDAPAGDGLKALSRDEHDFVQALAEAWMPRGGEPELSGADAELGRWMDDVVDGMPAPSGRELKVLLQLYDESTIPTRLRPFRALSLEARTDVLRGWLASDVWLWRNGTQAMLVLMGVGWTTHPEVVTLLRPHFRCAYGR
jgi:hypothetical protein